MNHACDRTGTGGQPPEARTRFISLSAGCFIGSMAIGERVKELRESKNLTQVGLAQRAGITERSLRDLENGTTRNPSTATVKGLASALGVPPEELLGHEPIERPAKTMRAAATSGPKSAREAVEDGQHYLQFLFKRAGLETPEQRRAAAAKLDEHYQQFETVTPALADLWLTHYVKDLPAPRSATSRKRG
jgi:transcriptional regulator with XRE-family HTH domain